MCQIPFASSNGQRQTEEHSSTTNDNNEKYISNNQRLCHATLQIHTLSLRKNKSELPSQLTLG